MNWPGFYSLGSAWLLLLAIPLIVFYFLKLKRPQQPIPSLALWRQVINDQRVNSPFQKFKRNILLLLQLLMLFCLALAAMQPYLSGGVERARYLPVLIDCSASMAALDQAGGTSRFEAARAQVRSLIDDMLPDQRLSLIAVGATARRLTDFTDNKRVLHEALDGLTVTEVPSRIEDSLRMTQALARTVPLESAIFYTDGNVPATVDFELPFQLNYQRLPAGGPNVGLTALNARRARGSNWDVFVRVEGTPQASAEAAVELLQDGATIGRESVLLDPGQSQRLEFVVTTEKPSALEVRLKPVGFDSLATDNVAWLDLPALRRLAVYCPIDLSTYRHALRDEESARLYPPDTGTTSGGPAVYDLLVTDQAEPPVEATVALFIGVVPDDLRDLVSLKTGLAEVVDWQRSAPLLQHTQLTDVQIADVPTSAEGVLDGQYEELGYQILAYGRSGPLLLEKRSPTRLEYYLLFHTNRSTLPYRVSFPILVANLVQIAAQEAELSEIRAHETGILPATTLRPGETYRVTGPDGSSREVESTATGVVAGIPAPRVGRYDVRAGSRTVAQLSASLLSPSETSLTGVEEIQFKEISVSAAAETVETDRPLWPLLAMAGFAFLLIEWWYFQRRPGGVRV